jgi:serine/threonine protein kinase
MEVARAELAMHEKVGDGRTATVHRAVLRGTEVAVKEFNLPRVQMSKKEVQNLEREIELMKELRHPLIVNLLGINVDNTVVRLVLDFCRGGHLFDLLHNNNEIDLVPQTQVQVLRDIAEAMAFLHALTPKIVHRDLKSLNVLLAQPVASECDKVKVKLCDFGHARRIDDDPGTVRVGTQHWMAPEVFMGRPYDHLADVYSFAMVMFEVFCREMPFDDMSATMVAMTVASGERPDMAAIPPDLPATLVHLMVKCWAHAPSERPEFSTIIAELDTLQTKLWF